MVSQSARAGNGGITGMGHGTRAGAVPQAALQASMIHRQHLLAGWVAWAATVMLVVAVLANGSSVWATDMMLDDESDPSYTAYGWTFLGLTLVSAAVASQSITDSQDSLNKASKSFKQYKGATAEADVTKYRDSTEKHHEDAKSAEERANLAVLLTILFGAASYYSFSPESGLDFSLMTSSTHVIWRVRF